MGLNYIYHLKNLLILKKKENVAATLDLIKNSIGIKYKVIGENVFISSSKSK